jgi:hypothetical protein
MILVSLLLVVLAVFGAPLFAIIATSAMVGFQSTDTSLMTIALELLSISQMPVLTAIPLFTFAGYLLSESNAPGRLVRLTSALFGWMPGGLALVCLAACAFFTAFTGASGVTIIALGAILYPALKQDGYSDRFNLGLVTSSGSLGLLFAPSLPIILYGVVAKVSIDDLFRAGIVPGLLMLLMLGGYSIWTNRENRKPLSSFSWREVGAAMRAAIWEIPLPIVVLGGIYSGFFAVSEAAAITALYVFIVEVLVFGRWHIDDTWRFIGIDVLHDRCGGTAETSCARRGARQQPNVVPDSTAAVPAGTGRNTRHLFGDRPGCPANPADRCGFRSERGASRHRLSGRHAARVPDAAGRAESLYRELSVQQTDHACIFCNVPIPDNPDVVGYPDHFPAGIVVGVRFR